MSETFKSRLGRRWAARLKPRIKSGADREALDLLADYLNDDGEGWPSVMTLCQDGGNHRSRGSMKRSLNHLIAAGHLQAERRGGGHPTCTVIYRAVAWNGTPPDSTVHVDPTPECTPATPDPTPECEPPDSTAHETRLHSEQNPTPGESQTNMNKKGNKQEEHHAADAADHVDPSPAGPAEQVDDVVVKRKSLQELAWGRWNRVAAQSHLPEAEQPEKHVFILLAQRLKHPAFRQDLERWTAYCQWLANHRYWGDRDHPATLKRALDTSLMDQWNKTTKPIQRVYEVEDPIEPLSVRRDQPFEPGFNESTDPHCIALKAMRAQPGGCTAGAR